MTTVRPSDLGKNFNVGVFSETVKVRSFKTWVMIIKLYAVQTGFKTMIHFHGHMRVEGGREKECKLRFS